MSAVGDTRRDVWHRRDLPERQFFIGRVEAVEKEWRGVDGSWSGQPWTSSSLEEVLVVLTPTPAREDGLDEHGP